MTPRELGKSAEPQAIAALEILREKCPVLEIEVSHSSPREDLEERWDILVSLNGICREIDLCISGKRVREKVEFNHGNGFDIILVVIDTRWNADRIAKEIMRVFIHSLPRRVVSEILAEIA